MSCPYPWLAPSWTDLVRRQEQGRIGHAYLFSGREGLGKGALADTLAAGLLCETSAGTLETCGHCRGCLLQQAGNHPDFRLVGLEDERKSIVIDQIRELIEFFTLKSHYGGRKIGIVNPADSMNNAAANALLKLLEEPPAGALLVLVAHRPALLPATIVSRCQHLHFAVPGWPERLAWLASQPPTTDKPPPALADLVLGGAPLNLKALVESTRPRLYNDIVAALHGALEGRFDALAAARGFADVDVQRVLDGVESLVQAAAQILAGHAPEQFRLPPTELAQLQEIANKLNFDGLLTFLERVAASRRTVLRSSGVRGTEIMENLMHDWVSITHQGVAA